MGHRIAVSFPNQSRSYDEGRHQIRFLGHSGMDSVPFRIDVDALLMSTAADKNETACLAAFDTKRALIEQAAARAYSGVRKSVYVLTTEDMH